MHEPGQILKPEETGTVLDEAHGGDLHAHPVPLWLLTGVFVALVFLTVVTVAVTYVDLGSMNLVVAMVIATIKAILVAEIFMHLRWDKPFHRFALLSAVVFVALFIGILAMDSGSYAGDMIPGYAPGVEQ